MGNTTAHAQEQAHAPAKYCSGVRVTQREGGDKSQPIGKEHRFVKLHYTGKLAGGIPAAGKGILDMQRVNLQFDQLYKPIANKGDENAWIGRGADDPGMAREVAYRTQTGGGKLQETMSHGKNFSPLGTAILKCVERGVYGGSGSDDPAPMTAGETFKLSCSKDIMKLYGDVVGSNQARAENVMQAQGLYNKRQSTAGVAKLKLTIVDFYDHATDEYKHQFAT